MRALLENINKYILKTIMHIFEYYISCNVSCLRNRCMITRNFVSYQLSADRKMICRKVISFACHISDTMFHFLLVTVDTNGI
jgi:hypothetical protein